MDRVLIAAMMVFGTLTLGVPARADPRDFGVVNQTGYAIRFIGVNEPGDEIYNENELRSVLAHGSKAMIHFSHADKGCVWNMKATATDGTNVFFRNLNLCTINNVTLRYNRATDVVSYITD